MALYTVPVDTPVIASNRAIGHRIVMSMLPDSTLDSSRPRGDAQALWWLDEDNDCMIVSIGNSHLESGQFMENPTPDYDLGEEITLTVDMDMSYAPTATVPQDLWDSGYRPRVHRRVTLPDDRKPGRATRKLEESGLEILELHIGECIPFRIRQRGQGKNLCAFRVTAKARIIDLEKFEFALVNGIGRLKNYGAGLIRINK